jgi:hypothetical protein
VEDEGQTDCSRPPRDGLKQERQRSQLYQNPYVDEGFSARVGLIHWIGANVQVRMRGSRVVIRAQIRIYR